MIKYILILISAVYLIASCSHPTGHGHEHNGHEHEEHHNHDNQYEEDEEEDHGHDHGHDTHEEEDTHVEDDHHGRNHENEHNHEDESGLRNVKDEFELQEISPREFREIIHTSGQILAAQGDEITVTAVHNGLVLFSGNKLLAGKKVHKADLLLTISGKELIHDNIEAGFIEAKTAYDNARQQYERAKELNNEKIISDKELQDVKLTFDKASNNFQLIRRHYTPGGQKVLSSINGYVKDVYVSEGEYVSMGQPLLKLTKNKRLVIKADVPHSFFPKLEEIKSANFVTVYDEKTYDIEDLNGRLVSFGKTTGSNTLFTNVYFEIDNIGNLLAGSFVEVFLKTLPHPNSIVIPKSALLEESGRYYVYLEKEKDFEKRYVTVDCNDGINYHITKGLEKGERIVTKNPYQIKLASLSKALPAHSHAH